MKSIVLVLALCLSGCAHWDELEPSEKVVVGVGAAVVVGALVIRNGQGDTVNNCISTRSIQTGCIKPGYVH